ncbi:hypothetical protein JRQ81_018344 [Phrynocephalus forsythii]|uniref:Myb/SANT-like DNA-binding domain-containing protein n=1 Tax=Phrynocephalus forsythii TaxID=171643 RepID=A0A9Q0XSN0_9SAUR|nr:hypothetical protein JRQ81_018344 [Phrynocephalus forsythii]
MEHDDSLDESQGSTKSVKGKRGVLWGNVETSVLIKIWGEAEVTYALSSLKRNYEIFELISNELCKIGFNRSPEECRTKMKSLRKLYKQAVLHNNTSGSGRSKFIWFDEMAQIFRTDNSIHPLRTTESESAAHTESMDGAGDVVLTLDLVNLNEFLLSTGSDVSGTDTLSNDLNEPSTSGCSTALSTNNTTNDSSRITGRLSEPRFNILDRSNLILFHFCSLKYEVHPNITAPGSLPGLFAYTRHVQ